ncbi:PucR family transcriptional regulator [Halalkalibacterium halodurans]|nr:PucR family transcriptional regulator [Halalkalibacterium halodurans]
MRVIDVLDLPTFQEAKVVAGENGVSNTIQSVNLMDAPDIVHFLTTDQLLLTTAYSLKNNPNALIELVRHMAEQGCAGLGLKTKRFIDTIPDDVLAEANRLGFPIIELPLRYSLGAMLNESLGFILKERTNELNYALTLHREFTNMILSGKGFSQIIEKLAAILEAPVILLNERLDIMAATHKMDKDGFFEVYWFIHEINHAEDTQTYQQCTLPQTNTTNPYRTFFLYPIHSANQQKGFLVVLGNLSPDAKGLQILALEQAANVISFELMKMLAIEQHARQLKNDFFCELVESLITREEEILNRGKAYQLDKSLQYVCLASKFDEMSSFQTEVQPLYMEKELRQQREQMFELLNSYLKKHFDHSILFTKGDLFVILIGFSYYNDAVEKTFIDAIRDIQQELNQMLDFSFSFGVSNYTERVTDIATAFQEAVDALRSGYRENKKRFIKTYRIKEMTELFKSIPQQKLKEFYQSSLKDLAFPETKEKQDLLETLDSFLNHHCQISETAKSMFIHRNTVIYRIKKCEEILGIDLKGGHETLQLRMALFMKPLLVKT